MDKKLLSILCCPLSHQSLALARPDLLQRVNAAIKAGELRNRDGAAIPDPLAAALVTDDGKRLFPVKDGIPVLLEGESMDVEAFS